MILINGENKKNDFDTGSIDKIQKFNYNLGSWLTQKKKKIIDSMFRQN